MEAADFSGYATKADLECSDGRTISAQAFKHMDGVTVPLVWQHGHNSPENVLGHVLLKHRDDGVYCYAYFNDTKQGQDAKKLVVHKDIKNLSIWANNLVEKMTGKTKLGQAAKQVLHGMIREVSLVLSGANPGAFIDFIAFQHDGAVVDSADEAIIYTGLELMHGEIPPVETTDDKTPQGDPTSVAHGDQGMTAQQVYDGLSQVEKDLVHYMISAALEAAQKADDAADGGSDSAEDKKAADAIAGASATHSDVKPEDDKGDLSHQEGSTEMTHNVFEQQGKNGTAGAQQDKHVIAHADMQGIFADAQKNGSLKDAVENYAIKHGISTTDILFPNAQNLNNTPEFNTRRMEWVPLVMNACGHSPFSRVRQIVGDLTQDQARALGYIKGTLKKEEWFSVTRRTTGPTTVYKKQKLDRDDILDITDFDVVAWVKGEMNMMIREEIARAILIGDGRDVSDPDKIKDPAAVTDGTGIRSITGEHELYKTDVYVNIDDASSSYLEVVESILRSRKYYKGSGTPTFYTTADTLVAMLLTKDTLNRRLWANKAELALALMVDDIVPVEAMEPLAASTGLLGVIVNLADYNIGADKGGELNFFDFFDIDYNQQKYLLETRISGALTRVKAALVVWKTAAVNVLVIPPAPTFVHTTGVITIPTKAGVVYKNGAATLSAGAQTALAAGASMTVTAVAASNFYFETTDTTVEWTFTRDVA